MKDLTKAFDSFENQKSAFEALYGNDAKKSYEACVDAICATYVDASTDAGKMMLNEAIRLAFNRCGFTIDMKNNLRKNGDKVVIVRDTTYLKAHVVVDQLTGQCKYFMHYKLLNDLRKVCDCDKITATDLVEYLIDTIGFIPLYVKRTSLSEMDKTVSYTYRTIKRIKDEGVNTDCWSMEIKNAIERSLNALEYEPNSNKYYFILQGTHGWYMKADKETNDKLKEKRMSKVSKEEFDDSSIDKDDEA